MIPRIHCITDFPSYGDETLALIETLVRAGVEAVQVRAEALTDRELFAVTSALVGRLSGTTAVVIVNDRLDVALAAGAHGVHLGHDDLPLPQARRLAPAGFLVGATCRDADDARRARQHGADYAGVGPVYPTATKTGLPAPIGLDRLGEAAQVLPAVAVSGIDADRVSEVMATGAHGVAMASALCRSPDPERTAREVAAAVARR